MRRSTPLFAALVLLTLCAPLTAPAAPPASARWPDTRAGALARGWVGAFGAGEDSMRTFLAHDMAAASLAERNVSARLVRYREMREQYGRFQLEDIVKSEPAALTVKLLDSQAKSYEAVFAIEGKAPFHLKSVTLRTKVAVGHSLFGGFHH